MSQGVATEDGGKDLRFSSTRVEDDWAGLEEEIENLFSSLEDLAARIDSPDLDVEAEDILVLQNAGPRSPSGMPEAGYLPIPKKLAKAWK